jgi:hypothetical protein
VAVADRRDRLDVALDEVAALLTLRRDQAASMAERIAFSLDIAALWLVIGLHALNRGDLELVAIAAREYEHHLAASSSVPARPEGPAGRPTMTT